MLETAGNMLLILKDAEHGMHMDTEALEFLAKHGFEQRAGTVSIDGIAIENRHTAAAHRTSLQDGSAGSLQRDKTVESGPRHREWCALYGGDSRSRRGHAEVEDCGDHEPGGAVHLAKEVPIDENTAAFGGDEIRAPAWCHLNFIAPAGHLARDGTDSFIFRDFAFFHLSDPDLIHACYLEDTNIFVAENVTPCKEFFAARAKDSGRKSSPGGLQGFNRSSLHMNCSLQDCFSKQKSNPDGRK
jgi:hypothetical protein